MIRVLLADDHKLVRDGLRLLLQRAEEIELVGEARDGQQAIDLAEQQKPDVVLMDVAMPGMNGLRAVELVRALVPDVHIVVLSMYSDEKLVREALRKGANGYVLKHSSYTDLLPAIRAVYEGKSYFSREVSEIVSGGEFKS